MYQDGPIYEGGGMAKKKTKVKGRTKKRKTYTPSLKVATIEK